MNSVEKCYTVIALSFKVVELFLLFSWTHFLLLKKNISGETETLNEGFEGTEKSLSMIALAFYDGLWAYDGW